MGHKPYRTLGSVELKKEKAEQRERLEKEAEEKKKGEIHVIELLKPFGNTIAWFVSAEKECVLHFYSRRLRLTIVFFSTEELYTGADVRQTQVKVVV